MCELTALIVCGVLEMATSLLTIVSFAPQNHSVVVLRPIYERQCRAMLTAGQYKEEEEEKKQSSKEEIEKARLTVSLSGTPCCCAQRLLRQTTGSSTVFVSVKLPYWLLFRFTPQSQNPWLNRTPTDLLA